MEWDSWEKIKDDSGLFKKPDPQVFANQKNSGAQLDSSNKNMRDAKVIREIDLEAFNRNEFKEANISLRVIRVHGEILDFLRTTLKKWLDESGEVWNQLNRKSKEGIADRSVLDGWAFSVMELDSELSNNPVERQMVIAQDAEGTIQAVGKYEIQGENLLISAFCTPPNNLVLQSIPSPKLVPGCASAIIANLVAMAILNPQLVGPKPNIVVKSTQDTLPFFERLGFKRIEEESYDPYLSLSVEDIRQRLSLLPNKLNSENSRFEQNPQESAWEKMSSFLGFFR